MGAVHSLRVESPYQLLKIEDIKIINKPNEHGQLYLKALIDESINFNAVIKASTEDKICVYEEEKSKTLFNGLVQNVRTTNVNGIYYLEIEALTVSFELDIKEKSRSFQNAAMTYDDLIGEILKDYSGYNFTQYIGSGQAIGKPLFQYKETDWNFLKRIASELKSELYCDIIDASNMFYFGRPSNGSYEIKDVTNYKACKNLKVFHEVGGYEEGYDDTDYFYYELERRERYQIGDDISINGKKLYVSEYSVQSIKDEVIYKYKLCRKNGVWQTKLYNSLIGGAALDGEVLAVDGEKVKLHLNIDETQNEGEASWFPYAPPTGNVLYSMPIVGTSARLYFPSETSEAPIITGCVRTNGSSCAKTSDTKNRYFGTEHGSEIEMTPGAVNIKGGSKEPLSISFDDITGVTIKSPRNLNLNADDEIIIKTPASVKVKAQSQIGVKKAKTENGFSVETDMHFKGSNVIKDGSCRETYEPYKDEPKAGTKPDPPPPPPEEKKGFDWGKLAIAAVAVVAIVVSVATFGVGTTLAIAAVGAVVACAAVGAVEGAKSSIDSQLAQNGGDKSKINYAEVAKAAFFGGVTGAKDMFLTEVCAAYDTLNQTGSFLFDICTLGSFHNSCKDFSEWSHTFFMDKAPYKEGFEDAEFVINTALLADGLLSISNIVRNFPKKFSIGQISLAELGINIPVVCSDGSIMLAKTGDLASIGGASSAMHNMESNSSGGSGGNDGATKAKTLVDKGEQFTNGRKNKLKPDIRYQTGEFDYSYETDSSGRLNKFETDDLQLTEREERLPHSKNTPGKIKGKDHAGHLAGDRFGGSPKIDNLVSQLSEVNLSEYKKIENIWAEAISTEKKVTVDMDIIYEGSSLRPSEFIVKYTIDGEAFSVPIIN